MRFFKRKGEPEPEGGPEPEPGELPADGPATVAGVSLGPGRRVRADLDGDGPEVLWRSDAPPPRPLDTWRALAAAHPRTGLWPLLVIDEQLDLGYLDDSPADVAPFTGGTSTGAAARDDAAENAFQALTELHSLALVAVDRPADILAAIGWQGATNHFQPAELVPALRSWEERFGARPIGLGFDTLHLAVVRPPGPEDAAGVAEEVYALCPDIVDQGIGSVEELATTMISGSYWYFWWD